MTESPAELLLRASVTFAIYGEVCLRVSGTPQFSPARLTPIVNWLVSAALHGEEVAQNLSPAAPQEAVEQCYDENALAFARSVLEEVGDE